MNIEELRAYCMSKEEVTENFPFGNDALVFKVQDKIFAITSLSDPSSVNLKCDPAYALELRERHPEIVPGYHMNKKHWNTVLLNGSLEEKLISQLIDHSYELVYSSIPVRRRKMHGSSS